MGMCRHNLFAAMLLASALVAGQAGAHQPREQIGTVLGKAVFRDEIRRGKDDVLADELHRLFAAPVLQKYREAHRAEIEPTEAELAAATTYFDRKHAEQIKDEEPLLREKLAAIEKLALAEQKDPARRKLELERETIKSRLNPPGRFFASFVLDNWKFQRNLYDRFGGGRILWQQAGLEAFDATRSWLEFHEQQGDFAISDPQLRAVFYEYWTTQNHGSFLTDDRERIRTEFVEPGWAQKVK